MTYNQVNIEPYARLFTTVLKWQKAEKKWTDGSFLELNAVQIESDINAFSRYYAILIIQEILSRSRKQWIIFGNIIMRACVSLRNCYMLPRTQL